MKGLFSHTAQDTTLPLYQTHLKFVPGIGSDTPTLMFIGEAPGEQENSRGLPFVGPAGLQLQEILCDMGLTMDTIYVTNVAKYRPPNNRTPTSEESQVWYDRVLSKEIETLQPKGIVCLGRCPSEALMRAAGVVIPKGTIRGSTFTCGPAKSICTWHPSYIIRNGNSTEEGSKANLLKKQVIEDIASMLD